jgi:hypothetical protein
MTMKAITVTLENLQSGNIRATGRHNGRTVALKEGSAANAKALLAEVMAATCYAHRVGNTYDLTFIHLNDAAQAEMAG